MEMRKMTLNAAGIMEFAHHVPMNVRALPRKGKEVTLISNADECDRLAQNHALVAVLSFKANFHLIPRPRANVHLRGSFTAQVVQNCVISGEEIISEVSDNFTLLFVPRQDQAQSDDDMIWHFSPQEDDASDFYDGNEIDLGSVVEEFFDLALDPYPRKKDAAFQPVSIGEEVPEDKPISPFAALKKFHSQ